ncbi:unnamed protein product [Lampetra fluviatilis]
MQPAQAPVSSPPIGRELRPAHSLLADLLHAVASILEEIHQGEPTAEEGGADLQVAAIPAAGSLTPAQKFEIPAQDSSASAGSRVHRGNAVTYALGPHQTDVATSSATRLLPENNIVDSDGAADPTKANAIRLSAGCVPSLQQRLPVLKAFSVAGGDWAAFERRFISNCDMARWTE